MINLSNPLIATHELARILGNSDVKLVDASWWLDGRDARKDFERERIAGAVFFDLEAISDQSDPLPHMLPSPQDFASAVGAMGISETDHIVVYDAQGMFSAARVWWMFRLFGANKAVVLDGGLPKWNAENRPLDVAPSSPTVAKIFKTAPSSGDVARMEDVVAALDSDTQILDARGAPRFAGTAPEPRAGVRAGRMPGAINVPYTQLLNADKTMKTSAALEAAFKDLGIDFKRPVITSCGSGVTAAILTLGLAILGKPSRLYDGSWSEWGSQADTPVETGA